MRRLFDPDLLIQDLHPQELSYPLFARLHVPRLPEVTRLSLPKAWQSQLQVGVIVSGYDDTVLPALVCLWDENPNAPELWVPFPCIQPDLIVLPN
jgi:hypothetical protein